MCVDHYDLLQLILENLDQAFFNWTNLLNMQFKEMIFRHPVEKLGLKDNFVMSKFPKIHWSRS